MTNPTSAPDSSFEVIVVGAGFAGMYMLHRLRGLGISTRVIEAGSDVGGTWYWNRYPGARCDVQSIDYSYSFSEEIQQEWTWSDRFSPQPEILAYANFVADKLDLRRDMEFDVRVVSAHFDDASQRWLILTDDERTYSAKYFIMATGCLSVPKVPEIHGVETFDGEVYYTGRWPHHEVTFADKKVGVIGTGSSGIQAIPAIAETAGKLYVFQRTPGYTLPARNIPLTPEYIADVKRRYPELRAYARQTANGGTRPTSDTPTFSIPPDERRRLFEKVWAEGGLELFGHFGDLMVNEEANKEAADFVREKISQTVKDQKVAEALKPYGYPLGARRLCIDTNYYDTYNRENVELVDVSKDPIEAVTPAGVKTRDAEYKLDMLVFATGFDAMTGAILAVDIRGREGKLLREKWANGPRAYLGLTVAGFPNFFAITGPGSPSVLSNVVASIEQHVEWISDCIDYLERNGVKTIEAREDAEDKWVQHVYDVAAPTLFMKANSWYLGANVPGKPRVFMPYVGGLQNYRKICDEIAAKAYDAFELAK